MPHRPRWIIGSDASSGIGTLPDQHAMPASSSSFIKAEAGAHVESLVVRFALLVCPHYAGCEMFDSRAALPAVLLKKKSTPTTCAMLLCA